jgi:hypothetical protein
MNNIELKLSVGRNVKVEDRPYAYIKDSQSQFSSKILVVKFWGVTVSY